MIHIVHWRKFGILVPAVVVGGAFGVGEVLTLLRLHGRWDSLTMFVPGTVLVAAGCWLDRKKKLNSFCSIPMRIWGAVLIIFGVVVLVTG